MNVGEFGGSGWQPPEQGGPTSKPRDVDEAIVATYKNDS